MVSIVNYFSDNENADNVVKPAGDRKKEV